jgi:hypothetical protein
MITQADFWDLLKNASLLIVVIAIILLISSELLSSYGGNVNILINKGRLRNASITVTIAFIVTVAMTIIHIITE